MSRIDSATLPTLPMEILHRIFDNLDASTVVLSVRKVCQRLKATADTYRRYELDLTAISKGDFHHLLMIIHPQHVTGLTLANGGVTPGQVGMFLSLIDIDLLTQLRSLTLLKIDGRDLCLFLEHARRCSLTSLTLESTSCNTREQQEIAQYFSSIIGQLTFLRLRLLSEGLCELIDQFEWPVQCKLQYLTMAFFTEKQLCEILLGAPDLQTLDIGTRIGSKFNDWNVTATMFGTSNPRLTSLTISRRSESIDAILSFLSFTPCLHHLKIINTGVNWMDGSRWEEFIKAKLPALKNFQFYSSSHFSRSNGETEESTLNRLISPFRTPFWTEEKRWSIRCNWFLTRQIVEIYTIPICTRNYNYYADSNTRTVSNCATEDRQSTISTGVYQLFVDLHRRTAVQHRVRRRILPVLQYHRNFIDI